VNRRSRGIFVFLACGIWCLSDREAESADSRVYCWGMQEPFEKLIRLRAPRRERTVELRVHYEISRDAGCDIYRIITIDEPKQDQ
jgi:hypothetical protein